MKVTFFLFNDSQKKTPNTVGMAVAQPLDFEIDFARKPISG